MHSGKFRRTGGAGPATEGHGPGGPESQAWECGGARGWKETWPDGCGEDAVAGNSGAADCSSAGTTPAAGGGAVPRSKLAQNEQSLAALGSSASWLCATCMNEASAMARAIVETASRRRCAQESPPRSGIERQKCGVRAKRVASGEAVEGGTLAGGSLPVKAA